MVEQAAAELCDQDGFKRYKRSLVSKILTLTIFQWECQICTSPAQEGGPPMGHGQHITLYRYISRGRSHVTKTHTHNHHQAHTMLPSPSYGVCSDPYHEGHPRIGKAFNWFMYIYFFPVEGWQIRYIYSYMAI